MSDDCYEYVRNTYGVPARVGMRVRAYRCEGVLTDALLALHYIHVKFDGDGPSVLSRFIQLTKLNISSIRSHRKKPMNNRDLFVLYHPPANPGDTPQPACRALVQSVNDDGTLQLWVFGPHDVYMPRPAAQGTEPFQWSPIEDGKL